MKPIVVMVALAAGYALAANVPQTPLKSVVLATPVIIGETFPGAPEPFDEAVIREELQSEAIRWLARAIKVNKVATETVEFGQKPIEGTYQLKSEFHIPVALPTRIIGLDAANRRGRFMSARFILIDPTGRETITKEVSLVWGDGHWLKGGPRMRKNHKVLDVLKSFVRKASDRAVNQMKRDLHLKTELRPHSPGGHVSSDNPFPGATRHVPCEGR